MNDDQLSLHTWRVVVVGAGQAGLAMADALITVGMRPNIDFVVVDEASGENVAWKRRWHSLTLFTPARRSALPGFPFPGDPRRYPRTDEVAHYLELYADRLGVIPEWYTTVTDVIAEAHGHGLLLRTNRGMIQTRNVVAATGPFTVPRIPAIASRLRVPGLTLHSDEYTHPRQIPDGSVLVVGAGNTGRQIARDLAGSHPVWLAAGSRQPELPQKVLGIDIFSWLSWSGVLKTSSRSVIGKLMARREVVIGENLQDLISSGVQVVERVTDVKGAAVHLSDGRVLEPNSIVWATGYEPGTRWLPREVKDGNHRVVQIDGQTNVAGLFTLGLPWMRSRGSALLSGVGRDAQRIARLIDLRP